MTMIGSGFACARLYLRKHRLRNDIPNEAV
jgi:hypothetical protein